MPVVVRGLTIAAPPDAIWQVLIDLERQPRWRHELMGDPIEVTDLEPPRHYGLRHGGGFVGRADVWLEPLPGGQATRVTWREALRPRAPNLGLPGAADPLLRLLDRPLTPVFELIFRNDLRRLRDLVVSAR